MTARIHQYIERNSGKIRTERIMADGLINLLYSDLRENAPTVFKALTSARASSLLAYLNFDTFLNSKFRSTLHLIHRWGIDVSECLEGPELMNTPQKLFSRKICYWECRPMLQDVRAVVSPADSRVLLGSFKENSMLFIKNKFFDYSELLGLDHQPWLEAFQDGDFAIFRLTPDKYHYNHTPVAGRIVDFYEIPGDYHSCNPQAVISLVTPYSKNKRAVTIVDTDQPGGTGAGLVAMIEVVALMIGEIDQCYSSKEYSYPVPAKSGIFVEKGQPKSLFRPGSSTVILLFQEGRVEFDHDLLENQFIQGVQSRFSLGFGRSLVETDLGVRTRIGQALDKKELQLA